MSESPSKTSDNYCYKEEEETTTNLTPLLTFVFTLSDTVYFLVHYYKSYFGKSTVTSGVSYDFCRYLMVLQNLPDTDEIINFPFNSIDGD